MSHSEYRALYGEPTDRPTPPHDPATIDTLKAQATVRAQGVTGIYPGGVQWAVKRNDLDPDDGPGNPTYMRMESEKQAREWYDSMLSSAKINIPEHPECWPELVAARIHWQVQGSGID